MIERIVIEVELDKWSDPTPLHGSLQRMVKCGKDGVWFWVKGHGVEQGWSFPGCRLGDYKFDQERKEDGDE